MDQMSKYSGVSSLFVNSDLNELALQTIALGGDEHSRVECIGTSAKSMFQRVNEEKLASLKLDELAMVVYQPRDSEPTKAGDHEYLNTTAKVVIIAGSVTAANAVYNAAVGVNLVKYTVGLYQYMTTVPATAGIFAQYFGALSASSVGAAVIQGAGLTFVVNAIPAYFMFKGLISGGAYLLNKLMAKKPEEASVKLITNSG